MTKRPWARDNGPNSVQTTQKRTFRHIATATSYDATAITANTTNSPPRFNQQK